MQLLLGESNVQRRISVLNVLIDSVNMKQALKIIEDFIAERKPCLVATANAEMVMMAQRDTELAKALQDAALVVPDGAGVVWAARYQGYEMPERVAGYDLVQRLLSESAIKGYNVFLFGGAPGIAERAGRIMKSKCPGLRIVGICDGFFSEADEDEIIEKIKSSQADILLVALGVPKQEKWLSKHIHDLNVPVSIGVGGTFDVMAGAVKRAPLWMQRANLEWLFRLMSQPQRAIRMLALPRFVLQVWSKKH